MAAKKTEKENPKGKKATTTKKAIPPPPAPEEEELLDFSSLGLPEALTEKEKRFCLYYTLPGPTFMSQTGAAVKAGYKKSAAKKMGYSLRRKPDVAAAIKLILESKVSVDVEEKYQKAMEMIDSRAFFNLADYVKHKDMTIKVGKDEYETISVEGFKDLSELTPEQLKAVDGVDYRGVNGTRVFIMADRVKTLVDIINMRNKLNGNIDENDFDIEATAEIIKGQLSMKLTARKKKDELSQAADFVDIPHDQLVEEL